MYKKIIEKINKELKANYSYNDEYDEFYVKTIRDDIDRILNKVLKELNSSKVKVSKTCRGFSIVKFKDNYGENCSLQISSAVEPHVWLGIDRPKVQIMWKDAQLKGLNLKKKYPETNEFGWCDFPIPEEAMISSRMHLNKRQALKIGKLLIRFAETGEL